MSAATGRTLMMSAIVMISTPYRLTDAATNVEAGRHSCRNAGAHTLDEPEFVAQQSRHQEYRSSTALYPRV
jgi:hypothetical protein